MGTEMMLGLFVLGVGAWTALLWFEASREARSQRRLLNKIREILSRETPPDDQEIYDLLRKHF